MIIYQAEGWISEKVQTASDESYRDPTNLQSKLQKHQAFEAELSANKGRVESVRQVKRLISLINTLNKFEKHAIPQ